MPGGDGTGPGGMGPMTGRGAGFCAGYNTPGYANPMGGRYWGRGGGYGMGGRGRGYRNWYRATGMPGWMRAGWAPAWGAPAPAWNAPWGAAPAPTKEDQMNALQQQAEYLRTALDDITNQIEELSK